MKHLHLTVTLQVTLMNYPQCPTTLPCVGLTGQAALWTVVACVEENAIIWSDISW